MFIKFLMFFTGPILYGKPPYSFPSLSDASIACFAAANTAELLGVVLLFSSLPTSSGRKKLGAAPLLQLAAIGELPANAWQSWNSLSSSPPVSATGSILV